MIPNYLHTDECDYATLEKKQKLRENRKNTARAKNETQITQMTSNFKPYSYTRMIQHLLTTVMIDL